MAAVIEEAAHADRYAQSAGAAGAALDRQASAWKRTRRTAMPPRSISPGIFASVRDRVSGERQFGGIARARPTAPGGAGWIPAALTADGSTDRARSSGGGSCSSDYFWQNPLADARVQRASRTGKATELDAAISSDGKFVAFHLCPIATAPFDLWIGQVGGREFPESLEGVSIHFSFSTRESQRALGSISHDGAHVWLHVCRLKDGGQQQACGSYRRIGGWSHAPLLSDAASEAAWSPREDPVDCMSHRPRQAIGYFIANRNAGKIRGRVFIEKGEGVHNCTS